MKARIGILGVLVVAASIAFAGPAAADSKNCANFTTQSEAEQWALANPADKSNLDNNGDGIYCNELPPGGAVSTGFGGLALGGSSNGHVPVPVLAGLATSGVAAAWMVLRRRPSAHRL